VHDNVIGVSQTGVAIVGNNANVFDNDIFDSRIFDGIELIGDDNTAQRNQITHSDQAGVLVAAAAMWCGKTSSTSRPLAF
jgi:pectin methylesterase-like acyl-CoA thioesterase